MQIDKIYRDVVRVGTSATSPMLNGAILPDDVQGTLCGAQIKHIDQFQMLYYQFKNTGLCRAQDPMGCQFIGSTETLCLLELPQLHCC